jgi:hypothetical protein
LHGHQDIDDLLVIRPEQVFLIGGLLERGVDFRLADAEGGERRGEFFGIRPPAIQPMADSRGQFFAMEPVTSPQ